MTNVMPYHHYLQYSQPRTILAFSEPTQPMHPALALSIFLPTSKNEPDTCHYQFFVKDYITIFKITNICYKKASFQFTIYYYSYSIKTKTVYKPKITVLLLKISKIFNLKFQGFYNSLTKATLWL